MPGEPGSGQNTKEEKRVPMPKMKTIKGAAKRLKKKPSGKIKFKHAEARHLLTAKSQGTKRAHRKRGVLSDADTPRANRMLPYG